MVGYFHLSLNCDNRLLNVGKSNGKDVTVALLGTKIVDMGNKSSDYMALMKEVFAGKNSSDAQWIRFSSWIANTDFFTCPASTRFHGSFEGGLCEHHLDVYNETVDLLKLPKFKDVDPVSAYLVALVHDYCKIGLYTSYYRNVKDDETGRWNSVLSYKYDKPQYPFGHGVASMYVAQQFVRLTRDEALAIRWHMGSYNVCKNEESEYQEAADRYPLVLLLHMADRLSITAY